MKSKLLVALILACSAVSAQQIYDLLIKNGRVIDPANHRDARLDVAVTGGRIVSVAPNLPVAHARVVVDVSGYLVTPGLIDINTHFSAPLKPDYNTLPYGVTTAVDAGTATCETLADFKKSHDRAKVRLLAFLSVADPECASRVARQNQETVVGFAASPSTISAALKAAEAAGTIVMLDGESPQMRPGDISTHVFNRAVPTQPRRGINLDTGGMSLRFAQPAIAKKFFPDTISSGMSWNNILLPRANMETAMSIFLNLGMTPEQIIERVTSNAARAIKRPQLGALSEGSAADIAILEIPSGKFGFLDAGLNRLDANRRFHCVLTVRNGAVVWDSAGLSISDTIKAGPYTNFK